MLGNRLTGQTLPIFCDRHGTDLEQRLVGLFAQPIDDLAAGRVGKRPEYAIEFLVIHIIKEYAIKSLHVKNPSMVAAPPSDG